MNPPVIKNSNFAKLSALSLCFFRQSMLYCWGKLCRCRLAVWRQLPKLISAGPTPVTCSRQKSALGRFFVWNLSNTGVGGRQGNFVAAGRRSPPTTKQRSSAVFRARPLKARLPSPAPNKKAPWGAFLFGTYRIRESGGGKATLLPQVGGLHRRQNSGHPLFSVRVRSRRDSRHLLQTKKRLSGAPPLILAAAQFKHCAAALCRNNRRQHRIRPQKFHPADKTARFRASRL